MNLENIEMIRILRILIPILILPFLAVTFSNCSTANVESPLSLVDASGNHPDGWITAHRSYAEPDGSLCMDCHGDDLAGGISGVSCSTASYKGISCHSSGPAFHPANWLDKSTSGDTWHADAYQNGLLIGGLDCVDCHTPPDLDDPVGGKCLVCHFTLGGSRTPGSWTHGATDHSDWAGSPEEDVCVNCHEINNNFGNMPGPFCHNCHDLVIHGVPFIDHNSAVPTSDDYTSLCMTCHSMSAPPVTSAPVCISCHTVGSPYIQTNCSSCHGRPPGSGQHGEHGSTCNDCHQGAGTGSGLEHFYDGEVDIAFSVPNFIYSGGNCTGTCHGESHNGRSW